MSRAPLNRNLSPYWRVLSVSSAAPEALNHGRCYTAFQIKFLTYYFMSLEPFALKSAPFDLKYGFAAFPLIGTRATGGGAPKGS